MIQAFLPVQGQHTQISHQVYQLSEGELCQENLHLWEFDSMNEIVFDPLEWPMVC